MQYPVKIVPHSATPGVTHEKWHCKYRNQLVDMYEMVRGELPEKIDNEHVFYEFSRMIYKTSSKYLTPF